MSNVTLFIFLVFQFVVVLVALWLIWRGTRKLEVVQWRIHETQLANMLRLFHETGYTVAVLSTKNGDHLIDLVAKRVR